MAVAQPPTDTAATRDYAVAAGMQGKKLYAQAAQRWQRFLQAYPNDNRVDRARHYLGICQLQLGQFQEAADTFRAVLANYPNFASRDAAQFNLGLALYNQALASSKPEELRAAAEAFAAVAAGYPQSKHAPAGLLYQAEALHAAGDVAGAAAAYARLLDAYPQDALVPQARYALGTVQHELNEFEKAAATFRAFLANHPEHALAPECRLRLALALARLQKLDEAAQMLQPLIDLAGFPLADLALLRYAQYTYELGQREQAVALYLSLPGKFPNSPYVGEAYLAAGKAQFALQAYPQAQQSLTMSIQANAASAAEASYWLTRTLLALGQPQAALAEAERAIAAYAQSPQLPLVQLGRIDCLHALPERRAETPPLYLAFAAQYPEHELAPQALYMASLASLQLQDPKAAAAHAQTFLNNPKYAGHALVPEVQFIAAEALLLAAANDAASAELVQAEKLYRELAARFPEHRHAGQSFVRAGWCLLVRRQFDECVASLNQALPLLKQPALAAEAHLIMGQAHREAQRPAQAAAAFRQALAAAPDWPRADEATLALAEALAAQDQLAEAAAELNRMLAAYPNSQRRDHALVQLGEVLYRQQQYDDALARFDALLSQHPNSPLVPLGNYQQARARFAKQDYAGAVESCTRLLGHPAAAELVPQARYLRGLAQYRLGQFQPALEDLAAFVSTPPQPADALDARYAIALCHRELQQPEQAAAVLKAILAEAPDYHQADRVLYELAFALAELKQPAEAAQTLRDLATRFPNSSLAAEAWYRVGEYHELQDQTPEALQAYQAGLAAAPPPELKEKLLFKLGWIPYKTKAYQQAAAAFAAQLQAFPEGQLTADAYYLAGECLYLQDKFAEAVPSFERVLALQSERYLPRALYRLGACAARLGQWAASEQHYQRLLAQHPAFEQVHEARYGLALAMQKQQKLAQARELYEQITRETETETAAKARFMIGECCFLEKKYAEAVEHYLTAALGYPYEEWQALGHFEAARAFIELGDKERAIDALNTVIERFGQHPKAADAKTLLQSLQN
jgi:TolA-binding protein